MGPRRGSLPFAGVPGPDDDTAASDTAAAEAAATEAAATEADAPREPLAMGEAIGHGAVATVVRLRDREGRAFAGKRLHESHAHDAAALGRFAQEAELSRLVDHDNVVRVYGRRRVEAHDVLVMELVDGASLDVHIAREAPMKAARIVAIARGIAAGLAAAHGAGVVHRDLKPSNVLLTATGTPKIADFGMARASSLAGTDPGAITVLGTPDTMAPEALDPLAVDGRTDLYALGCILFEMATGHPPYRGATPLAVLRAHRDAAVPELPPSVPSALAELIRSLLAKSPAERPQAADSVLAALDELAPAVEGGDELTPADAGARGALAVPATTAVAQGSSCPGCGARLVPALRLCLSCGLSVAMLEPGPFTVLVTGPGAVGDKIDSGLREKLVTWLSTSPHLGLTPTRALTDQIPRLPFSLVTGVSEASAHAFTVALGRLGLTGETVQGGAMQHQGMRAKSRSLAGRVLAIAATTIGATAGQWVKAPFLIVVMALLALGLVGRTIYTSARRTTKLRGDPASPLPAPVREALLRVEKAAPGIEHQRHRQALRGVVSRAVALAEPRPDAPSTDPAKAEIAGELATAVDAATAAAARLDALDRELATRDVAVGDDQTRALMHERDRWSGRLLRLSATLDALAARTASARARRGARDDEAALEDLRAHVEALEEVQGEGVQREGVQREGGSA